MNISREESDMEERISTIGIDVENYTKIMEELPNNTANADKPDLSIDEKGLL